jgi:hypothetical protein
LVSFGGDAHFLFLLERSFFEKALGQNYLRNCEVFKLYIHIDIFAIAIIISWKNKNPSQ